MSEYFNSRTMKSGGSTHVVQIGQSRALEYQ